MNDTEALLAGIADLRTDEFEAWMGRMVGKCPRWRRAMEHISYRDVANYARLFIVMRANKIKATDAPLQDMDFITLAGAEIARLHERIAELEGADDE